MADLSTRARPENPHYIATLGQRATRNPNESLVFRGWMQEQFSVHLQNSWEPIFGETINNIAGAATRIASAAGVTPNLKELSRQVWSGSGPLAFQLTFLLDAYKDTYTDVIEPIETLIKMATPYRRDAFTLEAPGPSLVSDERSMYLRVGRAFYLDSVVITDLDVTFHVLSDINGQYQAADVTVGLQTHYTPDQQDVLKYFSQARTGASNDNPLFNNQNVLEKDLRPQIERVQGAITGALQNTGRLFGAEESTSFIGRTVTSVLGR